MEGKAVVGENTRFCRSISICKRVALDPEEAFEEFDSACRFACRHVAHIILSAIECCGARAEKMRRNIYKSDTAPQANPEWLKNRDSDAKQTGRVKADLRARQTLDHFKNHSQLKALHRGTIY
jgi:hypothetical protein